MVVLRIIFCHHHSFILNRMVVAKEYLREKLYLRLVAIANELSLQLMAVYILEILGDGNNVLYKLLSFSSEERFLDCLVHCAFMTSKRSLMAKALQRYLLGKHKVQYHRPQIQLERIHVLILYSSKGFSGSIQENINCSRQVKPTLSLDDEWHKLIKDFENKEREASNPPAAGPIAPESPSKALQIPERRTTIPPRLQNASSLLPDPIDMMQCSKPVPVRHPPAGKENPIDMHSTPIPIRRNDGGRK
jgi:hypothetical protein